MLENGVENGILEFIDKLSPLPDTVLRFEELYKKDNISYEEISKVIKKDPIITTLLLKYANSPLYGFSREIRNIEQIVSLFGIRTLRGFVINSSTKDSFGVNLSAYNISNDDFLNVAIKRESIISICFKELQSDILDLISTSVFLMDIGKFPICQYLKHNKLSKKFKDNIGYTTEDKAEEKLVGMRCLEVTQKMFEKWKFDNDLISIIKGAHSNQVQNGFEKAVFVLKVVQKTIDSRGYADVKKVNIASKLIEKNGLNGRLFLDTVLKLCR